MQRNVSASVAIVAIAAAAAIFLAVFSRASLAPPEEPAVVMPDAPSAESRDLAMARQGLMPLGITAVLPPLPEDRLGGARVASVAPQSPAGRAGIQVGDLIASFDGEKVLHPLHLVDLLRDVEQERGYGIEVVRDREPQRLEVRGIQRLAEAARGSGSAPERGEEAIGR